MSLRIAFIASMVDPNFTPVFEELARRKECELLVLYESELEPNRHWSRIPGDYRHHFLRSGTVDLRRIHEDAFLHVTRGTASALKDFQPDVVIARGSGVWSSPANISAFLMRRRNGWAFVSEWESFAREKPTLPRRVADPWVKHFLRNSDGVAVCGSRARDYVSSLGVSESRITTCPLAVPLERCRTSDPQTAERPAGSRRFLFVGQLNHRKGVDLLLDAFAQTTGNELWIAGDGVNRDLVERAATEDDRITYFGHLPMEEVLKLYCEVDFAVVPSRYEVWGFVVEEAIALGAVVIASDQVAAADDLVRHPETGLIVKPTIESIRSALMEASEWDQSRISDATLKALPPAKARTASAAADGLLQAAANAVACHL